MKELEFLTKMPIETQNQKLRLFARVDLGTKLKILDVQKLKFHKLKSLYQEVDNNVLTLASLLLAIDKEVGSLDGVSLKSAVIKGKSIKKRHKREKLLGYWAIIKTLKNEQSMSFRQIARYLSRYHKLEVAHSTIYGLWVEVEKNKKNGEKENG